MVLAWHSQYSYNPLVPRFGHRMHGAYAGVYSVCRGMGVHTGRPLQQHSEGMSRGGVVGRGIVRVKKLRASLHLTKAGSNCTSTRSQSDPECSQHQLAASAAPAQLCP